MLASKLPSKAYLSYGKTANLSTIGSCLIQGLMFAQLVVDYSTQHIHFISLHTIKSQLRVRGEKHQLKGKLL